MLTIQQLDLAIGPLTHYLLSLGFSTTGFRLTTLGLVGEIHQIEYENFRNDRRVNFHLAWGQTSHSLMICKTNGSFHIDRYFIVKKMPENIENLKSMDNLKHPIDQNILVKVCEELIRLLDKYLKDVLEGHRWEDIPIDWAGYK